MLMMVLDKNTTKYIKIHPEVDTSVFTRFQGNLLNNCYDISVWTNEPTLLPLSHAASTAKKKNR